MLIVARSAPQSDLGPFGHVSYDQSFTFSCKIKTIRKALQGLNVSERRVFEYVRDHLIKFRRYYANKAA